MPAPRSPPSKKTNEAKTPTLQQTQNQTHSRSPCPASQGRSRSSIRANESRLVYYLLYIQGLSLRPRTTLCGKVIHVETRFLTLFGSADDMFRTATGNLRRKQPLLHRRSLRCLSREVATKTKTTLVSSLLRLIDRGGGRNVVRSNEDDNAYRYYRSEQRHRQPAGLLVIFRAELYPHGTIREGSAKFEQGEGWRRHKW